ncbi:uncharacterized protein FA14DRAFT_185697 [Meira miltonrushii]|uniref:Uncharacterized protein n=1 Tax=Meira miltonrushii TaxID=1280837 RepID=A0A316V5F3_9BASI|nr:uncharacterized protein FA14DRAFT_185697 [Meira miltonrushii]PWN32780.1 hypothetical protein FA14DRAFT_185697 [Meira miltonrushii]
MMKLQASPPSEVSEANNSAQAHYTSAEMNQQQSNRKYDEQLSNRESTAYKQQNLGSSSTGPVASSSSLAQSHSYTPLIQQSEKDDDHPFTPPSPYNRSADKQTFSPSLHHQGQYMRQISGPNDERRMYANDSSFLKKYSEPPKDHKNANFADQYESGRLNKSSEFIHREKDSKTATVQSQDEGRPQDGNMSGDRDEADPHKQIRRQKYQFSYSKSDNLPEDMAVDQFTERPESKRSHIETKLYKSKSRDDHNSRYNETVNNDVGSGNETVRNINDRATDSFRFHSPPHQFYSQYERQGQQDFKLLHRENRSELSQFKVHHSPASNFARRQIPPFDYQVGRNLGSSKFGDMATKEDQNDEEDSTSSSVQQQNNTKIQRNSFGSSSSLSEFRSDQLTRNNESEVNKSRPINVPKLSSSADQTSQQQHSGRTASFMSSLMRAARSPDPQTPTIVNSPMSIHSIIGGRSSSPVNSNNERRTRKRRTSSVQEPLQGSALESAFRARSSPRLSDFPQRSSMPISRSMHSDTESYSQNRADPSRPSFQPFETLRNDTFGDRRGVRQSMPGVTFNPSSGAVQRNADEAQRYSQSDHRTHPIDTTFRYLGAGRSSASPMSAYNLSGSQSEGERIITDQGGNISYISRSYAPVPSFDQQNYHRSIDHHRSLTDSSHGSRSAEPIASYSARSPVEKRQSSEGSSLQYPRKTNENAQAVDPMQWSTEMKSRAINEQKRWSFTAMPDKRRQVKQSVWDARIHLRTASSYWPPMASNVTTIRCMYANIAQKSYGSEKRFLCPPPSVKINGPLRPCKWISMRVISGDSVTPSVGMISASAHSGSSQSSHGKAGSASSAVIATGGGEEAALLDLNGEAKFGKLHVGSVSDATNKVFRLQVNLLRADLPGDEGKAALRNMQDGSSPLQLPFNAWSTFHSAPINVISKPARKSVRTRAASPAIASGSVVCLYNRLNSQTVRTKYLGVETGAIEDVAQVEVARRLVARQDGWEGFSIELLARPVNDPAIARANSKGYQTDDWGITYGSIVCLRDVNTKLCSDPMLICKVDKGKVELSGIFGNKTGQLARFQITSKHREEARQILFGGSRGEISTLNDTSSSSQHSTREKASGMPSLSSLTGSGGQDPGSMAFDGQFDSSSPEISTVAGGPVIQMQKVTLMHITPLPSRDSPDIVECNLSSARSYLCSTVNENAENEASLAAIARSQARLRSRSHAVRQGQLGLPMEVLEPQASPTVPKGDYKGNSPTRSLQSGSSPTNASNASVGAMHDYIHSLQSQPAPVGFARPPALVNSSSQVNNQNQIDLLEDQFCWTIVTISCTEVSYIEANAVSPEIADVKGRLNIKPKVQSEPRSPHVPLAPLPITPYPCFAALPSYDSRSHSLAATIHDYLYADDLDAARSIPNTVSAVHALSKKAAHEVWLGHSEPLQTHASSAGPHMSDVTIKLPGMEELMSLHIEFHANPHDERFIQKLKAEGTSLIKLPIVFVRVAQGVSFPSGHWLLAEFGSNQHMGNPARSPYDPMAWTIRII